MSRRKRKNVFPLIAFLSGLLIACQMPEEKKQVRDSRLEAQIDLAVQVADDSKPSKKLS